MKMNNRCKAIVFALCLLAVCALLYGTAPGASQPDWNSSREPGSLRQVFASGIRIFCLAGPAVEAPPFDKKFFARIEALHSPAARLLVTLHQQPTVKKLLAGGHFRIWDELAVIYLHSPHLFRFAPVSANSFCLSGYDTRQGYDAYLKLLGYAADSHLREREVVVLAALTTACRWPQVPAWAGAPSKLLPHPNSRPPLFYMGSEN